MKSGRRLPEALRKSSVARTDAAVERLFQALDQIETEVGLGSFKGSLSLDAILTRARLNADFLNSPKHKQSTRKAVESRVRRIRAHLAIARNVEQAREPIDEGVYWRERYLRLAREANIWFARMREQQKTIRTLKEKLDTE
jgi:hypothetical protein